MASESWAWKPSVEDVKAIRRGDKRFATHVTRSDLSALRGAYQVFVERDPVAARERRRQDSALEALFRPATPEGSR